MTLVTLHTVNCDGNLPLFTMLPGHAVGCPSWIGNEDSPAEARRMARRAGWKSVTQYGHRFDLSPQCSARREGTGG